MTPQHEDAAVQGGQVFAEEMDPGKPQGVAGLEGRRSPCAFSVGFRQGPKKLQTLKKKHVCLFLRGDDSKNLFCF